MEYLFMLTEKIRKLNINLPQKPIYNQRPWLIAGLLLAVIILMIAIYSYFETGDKPKHTAILKSESMCKTFSILIPGNVPLQDYIG
jgi:hypothetical protein